MLLFYTQTSILFIIKNKKIFCIKADVIFFLYILYNIYFLRHYNSPFCFVLL